MFRDAIPAVVGYHTCALGSKGTRSRCSQAMKFVGHDQTKQTKWPYRTRESAQALLVARTRALPSRSLGSSCVRACVYVCDGVVAVAVAV